GAGVSDHNSGCPNLCAVVHHLERKIGLVDDHISNAEVARVPAPAFHVRDDQIDLLVPDRPIELLDGPRIEVACCVLWYRAILDFGPCASGFCTHLCKLDLELLIGLMRW